MRFERVRPSLQFFAAKPVLGSLLLFFQAAPHPAASVEHLRYRRPILHGVAPAQGDTQACAVLDAAVFTHSSPSLKDLRIFSGKAEVPYAITLSEPVEQDSEEARVLNLGTRGNHVVFDLEMPHRPYTAVDLELGEKDFIATAEVSGGPSLEADGQTSMGSFTLFDLTNQHLSQSTSLPLAESSFPYLHVDLTVAPAPGTAVNSRLSRPEMVKGATVPPSREAQTVYTTVQQTAALVQRGRESVATFEVPAKVPVERISFTMASGFQNSFSRPVRISARVAAGQRLEPGSAQEQSDDDGQGAAETTSGTILSVHKAEAGREIAYESLTVPAAIGSNMQRVATLEVAIENGDDAPLPVGSVELQMRQRRICLDAGVFRPQLFYGDPALDAPVYDYAKLFQPTAKPLSAALAAESLNEVYVPRKDSRPFTEQHPELLWIVLLAVVCVLALTAFRSAKRLPR